MKNYRYISLALVAFSTPAVFGQFNQSINVEGKYVPEIIKIDRINTFPKLVSPSVETKALEYDGKSVPADFRANLLPMPATGWRDSRIYSRNRGYIDLGAGSWLNSTLSAGYRFVDNDATVFGAWLQHNSTSLWKPKVDENTGDAQRFRYDETLGVYANHEFDGVGMLSGAASWHLGCFNYYGSRDMNQNAESGEKYKFPTQTLNDVALAVGWQSSYKPDAIRWHAQADYRYFGYNRYYYHLPNLPLISQPPYIVPVSAPGKLDSDKAQKENNIRISGGLTFPTSESSSINLELEGRGVLYSGESPLLAKVGNSGYVTFSPNYSFSRDNLLVQVGVNLDYAHLVNTKDEGESKFYVSPDVKLDLNVNPVKFYLHLLGGVTPHTLASNYEWDYYQSPTINNSIPTYTPLDGEFGANFGPFSGFSAGLSLAYRISKNQYLGGWYQTYMNCGYGLVPGLPADKIVDGATKNLLYDLGWDATLNLHGFSLGLNMSYDAGRYFKIHGEGNYQPQNGEKGYFNGYDRPRWVALLEAETNPWNTLKLKLAYEYRGVRQAFTNAMLVGTLNTVTTPVAMRLPDVTNLNFGASYGISDNFDVWLQLDNILNTRRVLLPSLPEPGICAYIGFGLRF